MNVETVRDDLCLALDNMFGILASESTQRVMELAAYEGAGSLNEIKNPTNVQRFLMDFAVKEADYAKSDGNPVWELKLSAIGDNAYVLLREAERYAAEYKNKILPEDKKTDLLEICEGLHSMVHFLYDYTERKDETLNAIRTISEATMDRSFMESLENNIVEGLKLATEYSILCDDIAKETNKRHTLAHPFSEILTFRIDEEEKGFMDIEEDAIER